MISLKAIRLGSLQNCLAQAREQLFCRTTSHRQGVGIGFVEKSEELDDFSESRSMRVSLPVTHLCQILR